MRARQAQCFTWNIALIAPNRVFGPTSPRQASTFSVESIQPPPITRSPA